MKHNHNASIGCKVGNAPITAMSQINGQRLLAVSYLCMISERFGNENTTTRLLSKPHREP